MNLIPDSTLTTINYKITFNVDLKINTKESKIKIVKISIIIDQGDEKVSFKIKQFIERSYNNKRYYNTNIKNILTLIFNNLQSQLQFLNKNVMKITFATKCNQKFSINRNQFNTNLINYSSDTVIINNCCVKLSKIITQTNNLLSNPVKICFFYDGTGFSESAERSVVLPQLNELIFNVQGINGIIIPKYIGVLQNQSLDLTNIQDAIKEGFQIFCSALGSAFVLYLSDLFFNNIPENSGIMHVNSFSTSTKLIGAKNLIRISPPDIYAPEIFVIVVTNGFTNTNPLIIIYNPDTVFSASLTQAIIPIAESHNVPLILIPIPLNDRSPDWVSQINSINPDPPDTQYTILIISDFAFEYIRQLNTFGQIKFQFSLLLTDANANLPNLDPATFAFIQEHQTKLLQPFLSPSEINLIIGIGEIFNPSHPTHRVSSQTIQFIKAIDVSTLLLSTRSDYRNNRKYFAGISLDQYGNNSNIVYGLYDPTQFPIIKIVNIYYVYNGEILSINSTIPVNSP